jgi:hypothetical protein
METNVVFACCKGKIPSDGTVYFETIVASSDSGNVKQANKRI